MKITLESSSKKFKETFKKSGELTEQCQGIIPGGFSRRTFFYGPHAVFVERGDGAYIYTADGKKLLDMNNNYNVNILGHNHPNVTKALMEAIPKSYSFGNPNMDLENQLAKILVDRIDSIEKIKFSCSASESCHSAARLARGYTGKTKIAKMEGGYHGFTDTFEISAHPSPDRFPGPAERPIALPDTAGIPQNIIDNLVILKQNDLAACEKVLRENAHDLAAVFLELQSGAGGLVVLDKEFVTGIRAITEELGILLVIDETVTLRAGYGGLQGIYGVKPDITVMGKMIGGGIPIGAIGGSAEVFSVVDNDQVQISGTHHGHPLSMVGGIATMNTLTKEVFAELDKKSSRIINEVNTWAQSKNYPFMMYGGYGACIAYAFTDEPGREIKTHRDYWSYADEEKLQIYALEIATRGFFPVHRGQFSLSVPMTDDEITAFIETTKDIVDGILK